MLKAILAPLLLVAVACAGAQPHPPDPNRIDPLAFEIESPTSGRAMLFGSVHVARPNDWRLPERVSQGLARADLLVLEIDPSKTSQTEMHEIMLGLGALPPGQRLRQVVSPETWALLQERARESDLDLAALEDRKPWVIALLIFGMSLENAGIASEHGVERRLIASDRQIPIRGLETPFEQFSVFDDLPYPVQDRMLLDSLRPAKGAPDHDALLEAWRRGDARELEAILFRNRDDPKLARFYEATFDLRNLRMAEQIEEILVEGQHAFVVVGVGHLVGRRGLPQVLHDAGFRVRQISGMR